jgi:TonB family protein
MTDFFLYLSCSTLALAALYLLYKVLMSYETLHRLNRVLLLGFVVLSAVLPLCRIEVVEELPAVEPVEFVAPMADSVVYEVAESFNYTALLLMAFFALFLLGVVVMIARLVISMMSVKRIIISGEQQSLEGGVTLTIVDKPISPFSWFGHIVVSRADIEQNRDIILTHEMAHIRLRHSWDVLAVDLALCFWWFNPAMWLLRRELQSLHEYQADEEVINSGIDAQTYQLLLIKRAVGSRLHSVANCLNHSNLNKRITMMCKKTSSRWSAAKALLVLPLVAVSLAATATTVYVSREVQDKVTENSVNEQPEKSSVVKISKGKIYLNGEKITIEELKANVAEWDSVTIEADKDVKMGDVAELKEALRENGSLKVNYLVAEDEPKQNKKASAEEAPATEEKEREITVSEQPKDVATIVVKEDRTYLYNGKEVDDKELLRLLEEYECETINVVCETTELGVVVRDILPNVVKNVNYKYVLAEQDAIQALTTFKTNLRTRIQTRISNADCAMGVVYADVNLGRTGYVTTGNITVGDNVSSDVAPRLVKRVQDALNNIFFTNIRTEEPLSTRLEIVFAKNEGGKILPEDVTVGQDAIWVVGYDENVADAARVIGEETAPSNAVVVEKQTAGEKFLLSRSDMLVIIDGKEGKIDDITQDDVESFRVLNREEATKLFGEKGKNGAVLFNTKLFYENERTESAEKSEEDTPFIKVEKMPTFQGGDLNVFRNWVQSNVKYPQEAQEKALQGRVVFSFVVDKDGSVSEFQALQSPDKVLTDEVERVIKTSPKWEPGEQLGEKVRVKYTVPIVFQIKQ